MRFIARFAMRGPLYAATTAAALLLASLSLGVLLVLSGAVVALVTLRLGAWEGLKTALLALTFAVAVRFAIAGDALPIVVVCVVAWLPAWLMAVVLAARRQQAAPLMVAAGLVVLYTVVLRLALGDPAAFWRARLEPLFEAVARDTGTSLSAEQIDFIASHLHSWTLVAFLSLFAGIILLGRWWQAVLVNPGGFGAEFQEFSLPRAATIAVALVAAGYTVGELGGRPWPVVGDVFVTGVVLFAFQGLAVVHHRARTVSLATGWLAGLYVLLALLPHIVGPLLATAGVADSLADFRGLGRASGPDA